ncbi:predicted protein [Chaetomium globosum CBS 148.51]|uniref:Transcription fator ccdK n=1 Tax=Chaetomium globosum (strain ATCC 6205 / CBS 148.51 / DSM 1962 / NBRC 6347 / NRRL 1970) TaxID=306901 RepID=CCDK_CHAGB|nr:uncharacterized protein CHGG_10026 [Chaetomium globosum CBS 148.51]EAQ83622.1 predicted protein [Chaetomium globosum CBS 148.51]
MNNHWNPAMDVTVVQPYHASERPDSRCSVTAPSDPFEDDGVIDSLLHADDALAGGLDPSFRDQVAAWSAALTGDGIKHWDGLAMADHSHHAIGNSADEQPLAVGTAEFRPAHVTTSRHPPTTPPIRSQPQLTTSPACIHASALREQNEYQTVKGSLAALVRRAAELCDNMYDLRIRYHDGHSELDPPGHFPIHMSGEVLKAADAFLRLLRCFFSDEHRGCSTPTLVPDPPPSTGPYSSSLVPGQTRRVAHVADRPAALTLIASYRRLLDLYLLYYQGVYEYVRDTDSARRRNQPIWKDLSVGGAPLRDFGDLHIKLVMQAAARVLEDIEGALGLAEGCRVSRRSVDEAGSGGDGILGTVVTSRFVEQCIAEGATGGSEQGPGITARIRDMAAGLAALLDAPDIERSSYLF